MSRRYQSTKPRRIPFRRLKGGKKMDKIHKIMEDKKLIELEVIFLDLVDSLPKDVALVKLRSLIRAHLNQLELLK